MMSTVVEALYRNTIIDYMYRDVHNYPVINQCVISGVLTAEMENAVWECVCDNIYFIPSQVGLPESRLDFVDSGTSPWFEWGGVFALTNEAPTVDITAEKLVQNFQARKGKWDDTQQT